MILAQVRNALHPPAARAEPWAHLACVAIYLHPVQLASSSGESWFINTSNVVLAMADIRPAYRIPRRSHVGTICYSCSRKLLNTTGSLCETILYLIFGGFKVFITILGFVALGLESTLPIPQLIRWGCA